MSVIARFRQYLTEQGLEAFLLANTANCRYLSDFTGTDAYLLLTREANFLLTDSRYSLQAVKEAQGFQVITYQDTLAEALKVLCARYSLIRLGLEKEVITLGFFEKLQHSIPYVEFVPLPDPLEKYRQVKTEPELYKIRKAAEITDMAFAHILEFVRPGITEKEIALELEFFMRNLGAERNAFDFIVASGERGALPHGTASNKVIQKGEMLTLDIGCVYQGYNSDMTRTIFIGQPDARQKEIYEVVLKAQETALTALKPGMAGADVDAVARDVISQAGYGDFFGHGLGHGVGLEIHEGPRLSPRDHTILEPGMVVTVEPGIYLPGWGGVRIEDLTLITREGCEIISKSSKKMIVVD